MIPSRVLFAVSSVLLFLPGCRSSSGYVSGDPYHESIYDFRITSETEDGFDLEVRSVEIVSLFSPGSGDRDAARELFVKCARDHARNRGRTIASVRPDELEVTESVDYIAAENTLITRGRVRFGRALTERERQAWEREKERRSAQLEVDRQYDALESWDC